MVLLPLLCCVSHSVAAQTRAGDDAVRIIVVSGGDQ